MSSNPAHRMQNRGLLFEERDILVFVMLTVHLC